MSIENSVPSLGVLTVATNIYVNYWREMALSFDMNCERKDNVVLHVFTNQIEEVEQVKLQLKNIMVVAHEIPNYIWPEATLLRYRIFSEAADDLSEDLLMHLDADMLINRSPVGVIQNASSSGQICLVSHPGYWRPRKFSRKVDFYVKNFSVLLNDLRLILKFGGLGSWETDKESAAYVPRKLRCDYVCGGTWFGERSNFLMLVQELSNSVSQDLNQNRVAVWHDESHLNSWASKNSHYILDPELCFESTYPQLNGLIPTITAVNKKASTR